MIKRLSFKMAIIYAFVFVLAISSVDALLVFSYSKNQYKKTEAVYNQVAGVLSSMVQRNIKITTMLNLDNEVYPESLNGRILYLDKNCRVLADSLNEYEGRVLSNKEVRVVVKTQKKSAGYYSVNGKYMAMFVYPVITNRALTGTILISAYMEEVKNDIAAFRNQVIIISLIVFIMVLAISIYLGERITRPVRKLTKASKQILEGNLTVNVDIKRNDEIGVLGETFNRMSEELNKIDISRKRFVSDVSHELKTPLASIKVLVESMMYGGMDEETFNEYLNDIDSEIDRLSSLVKSLLTSARLEELELKCEPVNIYEAVNNMLKVFSPLAQRKGINLINSCEQELVIRLDKEMLKEVLANLIDNGIKYGKDNGYLRIATRKGQKELIIEDNGLGIHEKDIPFIFDNFYRVDEARTRDKGGSGIGLFIVKRICELHGWKISVESMPDLGSSFKINF